jgi:membrane protein implicated in regulation of membrane protease activity
MMGTQIEGLIFAVLVIPAALGWLIWQRYMNRFELPEDEESKPSKEELERQMGVLLSTKSRNKGD